MFSDLSALLVWLSVTALLVPPNVHCRRVRVTVTGTETDVEGSRRGIVLGNLPGATEGDHE
jgi:hypothetical protein